MRGFKPSTDTDTAEDRESAKALKCSALITVEGGKTSFSVEISSVSSSYGSSGGMGGKPDKGNGGKAFGIRG